MGATSVPQQICQSERRKICQGGYGAGMRLLAAVVFSAMSLSQLAGSEALPSGPNALLHGVSCGLGGGVPLSCGGITAAAAGRGHGMLNRHGHAFASLRGGGFGWGSPEQQQQQQPQTPFRRGASGLFGAAWGGGGPDGDNTNDNGNNNDKRQRVDTRGPPDLNTRLPATAPGSAGGGDVDGGGGGGGGGYFGGIGVGIGGSGGGGGGGGAARERVRTVGPPDAGGGGGRRGGSARRGFFSTPTAPPVEKQQQQQQPVAGGQFSGGRADPFWAGARPRMGFGGRAAVARDDGEGDGPMRGWGKGGGSDAAAPRGGLMAVHYLVLSCFALFSLNTLFGVDRLFALSLNHQRPRWWQSVTSLLLHGDQHHLMGNMFNLVIFGKMAEEDMGPVGMLASFVACGVASSFVSLMIMPRTISSCGASGAIFGLYSVCVLGKMFNLGRRGSADGRLRKLIEAAVFGWFVAESVMSEMRMVVAGGVTGIDHAAHFGGVFAGAVLILMFRRTMREQSTREQNLREGRRA